MEKNNEITCPKCGAKEVHPDGDKILIKAFKVSDEKGEWSQCLVCAGYYDKNLKLTEKGNENKGWFRY